MCFCMYQACVIDTCACVYEREFKSQQRNKNVCAPATMFFTYIQLHLEARIKKIKEIFDFL